MKNEGRLSLEMLLGMILSFLLARHSCACLHNDSTQNVTAEDQADAVRNLLRRLIQDKADHFEIQVDFCFDVKDVFQIQSGPEGKVLITGNKGYSAAAGVYHYLKYFCGCHVSWSGNQLSLPEFLPQPDVPIRVAFHDRYRYYQNVCTSSYSYVWWKWNRWEQEIDWMALNGINLPLAFTAQEAIWTKVFKKFNFTDHDINLFFTGPAFLAWNRMGNMQTWVGPLSENWHERQTDLQHKILARMRAFGMIPVLPAFSGRVVPGFSRVYPNASVTVLDKSWGHFESPYGYVTFLQPTDPMFQEIGEEFLRTYIEEFGTDHFYNADLFNEMPPPSNNTRYLRSCSKSLYKTITAVDPDAIWVAQGWMFFADPDIWKPAQAKAFLRAVPLGRMIILDLQSELFPQYPRLNSYYGQPFIWCMLHNYGGVKGLYGSLSAINEGPFEGRYFENSTMIGTGLTPEGIETNDVVYELMNEMSWREQPVDLDEWLNHFILRRYGAETSVLEEAWMHLSRSVFNASAPYSNHGKYILIRRPSLSLKPFIWYDVGDVYKSWALFVNASQDEKLVRSELFKHDLVDLTRQSLQLIMDVYYEDMRKSFRAKQLNEFRNTSKMILDLYQDLEDLLSSDQHFLLGIWLDSAKSMATTFLEERQYEYNARNQITLWGPDGQILDYANKQWAGLMSNYYRERWKLFMETLDDCLTSRTPFVLSDFNQAVFELVESPFNMGEEDYAVVPTGDPIEISERLLRKYEDVRRLFSD